MSSTGFRTFDTTLEKTNGVLQHIEGRDDGDRDAEQLPVPGSILCRVPQFRIAEAAELLGVSDDTMRRWLDAGKLPVERDHARRMVIDGASLAAFAREHARPPADPIRRVARSARNRFVGLVTDVSADTVMAQIEVQCGPHRVVSLMSAEAARELGLAPGSLAVAVMKSTHVVVETVIQTDTPPNEGT